VRIAFVLHLHYEEVALELLERLAGIDRPFDVFATGLATSFPKVRQELRSLSQRVEIVRSPDAGRDVGPFLRVLPEILAGRYTLFCKLHTKRGMSGYGSLWRREFYEALIGRPSTFDRTVKLFSQRPSLSLVGPAAFFLSVAQHMPSNACEVSHLARLCFPGSKLPDDWGFFAGTMFWGRTAAFGHFAGLHQLGVRFPPETGRNEEQTAHALERVFGLAGQIGASETGLVDRGSGAIRVLSDSSPPAGTLQERLIELKGSHAPARDLASVAAIIRERNPLLHFIQEGMKTDFDPNPFFHTSWYRQAGGSAALTQGNPLSHYIDEGVHASRDPSPLFNTGYYYQQHPDLRVSGVNPLVHFLQEGQSLGHAPTPPKDTFTVAAPAVLRHQHRYVQIDLALEKAFLARLNAVPASVRKAARRLRFSVIFAGAADSADTATSVGAVLAQSHRNFELIVVSTDDGATRGLRKGLTDRRVRFLAPAASMTAARNRGLANATGDLIAYFDAGNRWKSNFLETMALFMSSEGHDSAYSISEFRESSGLIVYEGASFTPAAYLSAGRVPLNAFCHRRSLSGKPVQLDETLALADLDLLLRFARRREPGFAPFVGCVYRKASARSHLATPPAVRAWSKVVEAKNAPSVDTDRWRPAVRRQLSLTFGIKIAAFRGSRHSSYKTWGDFHFAEGLKAALERLGHKAFIDPPWEWSGSRATADDVAIVVRGLLPYEPPPDQVNVLWVISHPDAVSYSEYAAYDLKYVASRSYASLLRTFVDPGIKPLLQATDPFRFHLSQSHPERTNDVVFVGNSRGEYRELVRWAVEQGLEPAIYGTGWQSFVPQRLIRAEYVENARLSQLYSAARVVLNDHYESMREFGFVSNRVYDVIGSGGRLVSDRIPSLGRLFGRAVKMVRTPKQLAQAVTGAHGHRLSQARRNAAASVASEHSFDRRALEIMSDLHELFGLGDKAAVTTPRWRRGLGLGRLSGLIAVRALLRRDAGEPDDAAFIRIICPMTSDAAEIDLKLVGTDEPVTADADVYIVQQGAIGERRLAELVRRSRAAGRILLLDVDRAELSETDRALLGSADQAWFANTQLRRRWGGSTKHPCVVRSGVDRRLWKDYSRRPQRYSGAPISLLMIERAALVEEIGFFWTALERLEAHVSGAFHLYVATARREIPKRTWVSRLLPTTDVESYPRFAEWLRQQGPFDAFVSPTENGAETRFLESLAAHTVSVVPDTPSIRDLVPPGAALFATADVESWLTALKQVVSNPGAVDFRSPAAQRLSLRRSAEAVAGQQMKYLRAALAKAAPRKRSGRPD
jgi:glycosyltransferase involved in cell wall biosynthesis